MHSEPSGDSGTSLTPAAAAEPIGGAGADPDRLADEAPSPDAADAAPPTEPGIDPALATGGTRAVIADAPEWLLDDLPNALAEGEPGEGDPPEPPPPAVPPPAMPPIVDVTALDWDSVRAAIDPGAVRARMRETVERMEALLDRSGGPGLLFDDRREHSNDRALNITALDDDAPLWFIGDLHGDLLALEAALTLIDTADHDAPPARLVFLGDLIDDGGFGLEVLLRVLELITDRPEGICFIAGNHDEALGYNGARFTATVRPSDFSELLNANLAHEWMTRAGKIAVRLFAAAPRALFFPDGLLVAHGGFPLSDLHAELLAGADWNDPRCLADFVWTRAHPRARRKIPNRASRGSQFGHEDFAAFCAVASERGRPVTHMVRGHDHVDERFAIYPAYATHPMLTTVALSRQLAREAFGPYERVPTVARWVRGALPQVHRLHVPPALVREIFPEETVIPEPAA